MSDINIGLVAENQNLSEFEITNNFQGSKCIKCSLNAVQQLSTN